MSFLRLFTQTITHEKKGFFQNYKVDEIRDEMSTSNFVTYQQNWNLSFRNFLSKYESQELHDKEQKIFTNFFYFYVLKELSFKIFS